jgi:hypothetical protein
MAKAFPFSPGFVAWGFELSPEFEPQPGTRMRRTFATLS